MKKIIFSILVLGLFSCQSKMQTSILEHTQDSIQTAIILKDTEISFDKFFDKFSSDSIFQIHHIKFPLKVSYQDIMTTAITSYTKKEEWKFIDFQDNATSQTDQYQFIKEVSSPNTINYKMLGIDNRIFVVYKFILTDKEWILEEIEDAST